MGFLSSLLHFLEYRFDMLPSSSRTRSDFERVIFRTLFHGFEHVADTYPYSWRFGSGSDTNSSFGWETRILLKISVHEHCMLQKYAVNIGLGGRGIYGPYIYCT